jgi:xanthine dehydrogenase small subunit
VVHAARFAFGGMAAIVKRAAAAECAVVGQDWSAATAAAAAAALTQDFKPLSDLRASRDYRLRVAQNLFTKAWLEHSGGQSIRVWELQP